jgi:hypothetical protein
LIAGFSVSPVSKEHIADKGGLIMSVTNKKSYKVKEGMRSVTFESFNLIFGNHELRIRDG